jgi:hypothetical protein
MRLSKIAAAGLLGLFLTQPANAAGSIQPQALKALFPGNFEALVHGYSVSFTAHKDGSLVGRHAFATDSGRWSIKRGRLCIMLSSWLNGRTACSQVVHHGAWYRANDVLFRKP